MCKKEVTPMRRKLLLAGLALLVLLATQLGCYRALELMGLG